MGRGMAFVGAALFVSGGVIIWEIAIQGKSWQQLGSMIEGLFSGSAKAPANSGGKSTTAAAA